jgi:leucyl-tRNA---protein transferase
MNQSEILDLSGRNLDTILAAGWYRGGDHVFTTESIYYSTNVTPGSYPVYWLRYDLEKLNLIGTLRKLHMNSQRFEIDFLPFELTEEYEDLYFRHSLTTSFFNFMTLRDFLSGDFGYAGVQQYCVFDTRVITLRKDGILVGAGITDMGKKTMAGIANFFDSEYRKLSPGKMLVVLKLLKAREKNMQYFYPGYIAPGISSFDYKTFVGTDCIEVWNSQKQVWQPFIGFDFGR